ncbi:MAG: discoidin domain-containing protein, partial [Anaerolineae bacterium]|nr:discoidin domain-containing protein [Anaerolineae bacterium]
EVSTAVTAEIRSLEEVAAGGPPQIVDITDADAVLIFESSIPLACSVVYGTTTGYGQIATDQDMSGGAHTDHHPLLVGLEPDTEYHYRVQGTAADGTLYVGEDATFRTLPAEERTEVNLASLEAGARVVAVSSNFGGAATDETWGADSAIDGNRGTAWSSNGDGNDAFIEVELAEPARVHAVEVWTRSMSDGTAQILAFTLTTDTGDVLGPFEMADAAEPYRFELEDVVARSLRLDVVESSGGNTGLVEFAVYGTPIED